MDLPAREVVYFSPKAASFDACISQRRIQLK
jgi:hypothetical protein